ncbi:TetR/AcrR family transcriptional regulator [Agrilactobacillus yilanensis]|uniref:TetR/AcrR family transcriptional regulator n=1 Tax=Agrilactobacillus yilanensis TaxID=2485997 RepID=A0ABW4J4W4_9LACO|nr:TetR/AcrR family transcriptional regulator [Agrilactobacillus yilanensis]
MKYDLTKKRSRSAQRTLDAFSEAMLTLIGQKNFEKININELCDLSNFPRATFYNYFDDKFDLLDYCWYLLIAEAHLDELSNKPQYTLLEACNYAFDHVYDLFKHREVLLKAIVANNSPTGSLITSFITSVRFTTRQLFYQYFDTQKNNLPTKLVADHVSNTILLLIEWIFLKNHDVSKAEAHNYIEKFLGNLC